MDKKLNELIATKILQLPTSHPYPDFSGDNSAASVVLDRMIADGWSYSLNGKVHESIAGFTKNLKTFTAQEKTMSLAICKAALEAIESTSKSS
jgi:hypothetical protein